MLSRAAAQPGSGKCMIVELQQSSGDMCFDGDAGVIGRMATTSAAGMCLDLKGVSQASQMARWLDHCKDVGLAEHGAVLLCASC